MSTTITHGLPRRTRPQLRLLRDDGQLRPPRHQDAHASVASRPLEGHSGEAFVLVAGADAASRTRMLEHLRKLFPKGTEFAEAGETWEVVAQAGDSRMVVLTGDLGDLTARGLMRVLSRRHPLLPVIALGDRAHGGAPEIGAVSL